MTEKNTFIKIYFSKIMCTYGGGWVVLYADWLWWRTRLGTDFKLICSHVWLICTGSSRRCETHLCRIRPMRSSLKHFCMALIRPGDIMQIPANVPCIRDEHRSLPPSPWCHRYHDGITGEQNQMYKAREHFRASRREQDNLRQWLMEFQEPF